MRRAILLALAVMALSLPVSAQALRADEQRTPVTPPNPGQTVYNNAQYGFCFDLPSQWAGYKVIEQKWQSSATSVGAAASGPRLLIRSPHWTDADPREDIPILVFTKAQWKRVQQEELMVSAAPVPPQKLGQNKRYVFALPPRWNFDELPGMDEANQIVTGRPLHAPCHAGSKPNGGASKQP
ncbi:hypothetical protein [Occallatibacter riparius]|uniref:Uncharacterized protein n=1 Tax=Occallatibacter riparius TaxID=1002689 RepID=A0A9J7BU79_9BACT|nr:hypothetical protein [Occallatibacter riparius]UWZ84486.1 hypothetical protein MOP44_00790 [Occallatibacter riparius]